MNIHTPRNGMATPLVVTVLLVVAALAGAALYQAQNRSETPMPDSQDVMEEHDDDAMTEDGMMKDDSMTGNEGAMTDEDSMMKEGEAFKATGTVIAGTTSPFIVFNAIDYAKALSEGKTVLLYFYANWCPICRVEIQDTEAAFRELKDPDVVGFRVNYNDNETDDDEVSLARQFGIAYQHTKVILVGGTPVVKDGSTWDRDTYLEKLAGVKN